MFSKSNIVGFLASVTVVLFSTLTFASDAVATTSGNTQWALALGAGIGMAIAAFGGALGQGRAIAAAMEGIARNPGADKKIFTPMIIGLVFIEVMVILTFVVANGLSGKI